MSFDLTILGERSFKYESENKYTVKYIMDSIDQGNLVRSWYCSFPFELFRQIVHPLSIDVAAGQKDALVSRILCSGWSTFRSSSMACY